MKSGILRRTLFAGLIYIVAIIGLVVLQFSSPAGISWRSGIVSMKVNMSRGEAAKPENVFITIGAIRLRVSKEHPAVAVSAAGKTTRLSPVSARSDTMCVGVCFWHLL